MLLHSNRYSLLMTKGDRIEEESFRKYCIENKSWMREKRKKTLIETERDRERARMRQNGHNFYQVSLNPTPDTHKHQ